MHKTAQLFSFQKIDLNSLEEVEESLLLADAGYKTTADLIAQIKKEKPADAETLRQLVYETVVAKIRPVACPLVVDETRKPFVVLMVGVNGAGKTTTIGKLGEQYIKQGKKVAFVAGDTFRAGATEQLQRWGDKTGARVYTAKTGADAAGLIFDALQDSQKQNDDMLFIDTAGRLQNRNDLMDELGKINRVIRKVDASAPHAVILVLDATGGQNAVSQVKTFLEKTGVTGLIMTKLDGTAKGGVLLALADEFRLPVHALGVGEKANDLQPFTAEEYAESLLGDNA